MYMRGQLGRRYVCRRLELRLKQFDLQQCNELFLCTLAETNV